MPTGSHCWWQIGCDCPWDTVASVRPSPVVNWGDIQVESDAQTYVISLAHERNGI